MSASCHLPILLRLYGTCLAIAGDRYHRGRFIGQLQRLLAKLRLSGDAVPAVDRHVVSDRNWLFAHLLPVVHFNGHDHRQNRVCKLAASPTTNHLSY